MWEQLEPHVLEVCASLLTAAVMYAVRRYKLGMDEQAVRNRINDVLPMVLNIGARHIRKSVGTESIVTAKEQAHDAAVASLTRAANAGTVPKSMMYLTHPEAVSEIVKGAVEASKK